VLVGGGPQIEPPARKAIQGTPWEGNGDWFGQAEFNLQSIRCRALQRVGRFIGYATRSTDEVKRHL